MAAISRAKANREARRRAQFAKFRNVYLNLIPLVDTFVSIVFFALVTQTLGEVAPVMSGVTLPEVGEIGGVAEGRVTVAVSSKPAQISIGDRVVMSVREAASAQSNIAGQPLVIPALYTALRVTADSVRTARNLSADESVTSPLAIQGDRTMRYDLLSRIMHTARMAGFRQLQLQLKHREGDAAAPAPVALNGTR